MAIFQAAMMAIGMIGGAQTARIQAKASMKVAEEQTKQSKAKQEELNAQSELARSIQKINNDRIMRAADKTFAAAATNLSRNRAATQTSNVMTQIAQAEAHGFTGADGRPLVKLSANENPLQGSFVVDQLTDLVGHPRQQPVARRPSEWWQTKVRTPQPKPEPRRSRDETVLHVYSPRLRKPCLQFHCRA